MLEHNVKEAKPLVADVMNRIKRPDGCDVFQTGYRPVDNIEGGLRAGQLVTIGSCSFEGKSFSYCILRNMLLRLGISCALFSLEETFYEIGMHLLHFASGIPYGMIIRNSLPDGMDKKLTEAACNLSNSKFISGECHLMNFKSLCNSIRRQCNLHGEHVVFIHTLNSISLDNEIGTRKERLAAILQKLKLLAMELNVCIIIPYCIEDNKRKKSVEKKTSFLKICSDVNLTLVRKSEDNLYELIAAIEAGFLESRSELQMEWVTHEFFDGR